MHESDGLFDASGVRRMAVRLVECRDRGRAAGARRGGTRLDARFLRRDAVRARAGVAHPGSRHLEGDRGAAIWRETPGAAGRAPRERWTDIFGPDLLRLTIPLTVMNACTMFGWWGFNLWLPGYLSLPTAQGGRGLSAATMASFIMAMQVGMWLGYVTFGFISDSLGRKRAYVMYTLAAALTIMAAHRRGISPGGRHLAMDSGNARPGAGLAAVVNPDLHRGRQHLNAGDRIRLYDIFRDTSIPPMLRTRGCSC